MLGAVAGDIIGSVYEHFPIKKKEFSLFHFRSKFTDDTVLTLAVAQSILSGRSYREVIRDMGRQYPLAGYGWSFFLWLYSSNARPYNSWGNGSAMRVSPIGFVFDSKETVMREAEASAKITHNHPEGIKGAQATALAIFLGRTGATKNEIKNEIENLFGYNLNRTVDSIRPKYGFNVSCQGTVPEAIISFLDSQSWEDAVRNAISLGGDSDTLACITGGIAEAFYGSIPEWVQEKVMLSLPQTLKDIVVSFTSKYSAWKVK